MTPTMKTAMRAMCVVSVPMTAWFPAGVFCYWIPNNIYSVILSATTRAPAVRQALGLNVSLAAIPGTQAAVSAQKITQMKREAVSPDVAAMSYVKRELTRKDEKQVLEMLHNAQPVQKPILFKSKKEAKAALASSKR
jgi:membrane protein insertase Oxa1/YidC/SpoIIIJ